MWRPIPKNFTQGCSLMLWDHKGGSEKRRTRKREEEDGVSCHERCKSLSSGEATTRPSAAGARWSQDRSLRRADSVARRMRQRSTCGFGARPSWRRDGRPNSERVSGSWWRRPSEPRRCSELFWGVWSEAQQKTETQQKLHLQDNIFLFGPGTICSSCNACSFFVYIYVLHTKFTPYATFYHSEHCLWINLVHSMHLTEFTTNPTTTDCTRVFPKVTLQNLILWDKDLHLHVVYLQASSLHCSFTHVKHSTTSSFTGTGGFVNICPTPAVAIDTWMESSSRVRQHENRKLNFLFKKGLNWIFTCIFTCAEVLK